jgi:hypothetical protein
MVQRVQQEEEIQRMRDEIKKKQHQDFKNNLLLQMGQLNNSQSIDFTPSVVSPSSINGLHSNRRRIGIESMTAEELKINKQMLQEIS